MTQTTEGGRKTAETIRKKFGPEYYQRIGKLGGRASHTGGFYNNPKRASEAGRIGGTISRRGPSKKNADGLTEKTAKEIFQK